MRPVDGFCGFIGCNNGEQLFDLIVRIIRIKCFSQSSGYVVFVIGDAAIGANTGALSSSFVVEGNGFGVIVIKGFNELTFVVVAILGANSIRNTGGLIAVFIVFVFERVISLGLGFDMTPGKVI